MVDQPTPIPHSMIKTTKIAPKQSLNSHNANQIPSREKLEDWVENKGVILPAGMLKRTLEELQKEKPVPKVAKKDDGEEGKVIVEEKKQAEDAAAKFSDRNPEFQSKTLQLLLSRVSQNDTPESLLAKVLEIYPDYSLADEALEFLIETTGGRLQENLQIARDAFNRSYGREIRAGRNIKQEALDFSSKGLGSPTALRDMYRDITGSPRDPQQLFQELFSQFPFEKLKTVVDFFLHSLGSDIKSKGPSISRPELQKLVGDTRTLQAILGVYTFFESRMKMIHNQFLSFHQVAPADVTFELLAKQFLKLLQEKYVSIDKILQISSLLGVSSTTIGKIILFTQMRDAIRQVAPKLYRNNKHKQDVLDIFLEALEELEDELDSES